MTREIKFRAWDKEQSKMFKVVELSYEDNATLAWREPYENEPVSWCKGGSEVGKECEVMQYTGLKDNNGKEIYEGDIVKYLDGGYSYSESGYDEWEIMNIGQIIYDEGIAFYDVTNKNSVSREDVFEGGGDFEVIGNIYENPELLEDTTQ